MIFLFNGPPGSGKDEACSFLKSKEFEHASFKSILFKETCDHFNVSLDWFMNGYNDRKIKETKEEKLNGLSRREALIYVSEDLIKPKYGNDYYGVQLAKTLKLCSNYSISDSGFIDEAYPIINKIGAENIILIQLYRDGCNFSKDSRKYIYGTLKKTYVVGNISNSTFDMKPEILPLDMYCIHNNGTVQEFHSILEKLHQKVLNDRENRNTKEGVFGKPI